MNTESLLKVIGAPEREAIITGRCGNAWLYTNGYTMVDPCYVDPEEKWPRTPIGEALRSAFPWDGYDYPGMKREWHEFRVDGHRCWMRDTDGDGTFHGCAVDSGCLVVVPEAVLPEAVRWLLCEPAH